MDAIRNPSPYHYRDHRWAFIDLEDHLDDAQPYIFGRLCKYAPDAEVTIVDEQNKAERLQGEPNLLISASPFVYLPNHSGIAFLRVSSHIEVKTFCDRFTRIIEGTYSNFFVDCEIELISDLRAFATKVSALDSILELDAKVSPPNPLFGPLWAPLKDYLISRNSDSIKVNEKAAPNEKIKTDLASLIRRAANDEDISSVEMPLIERAIFMSADGYGHGYIKGKNNNETVVIKTSETAVNFNFKKSPASHELSNKTEAILNKIQKDRHMEHGSDESNS
ncbi:hypothetical protein D0B32_12245 [Paraburkholderia sp. DHOC27]|nr:hypothetical protein D0B32_12245 [Paraburkholderia sp. DHOC27]